MSESPRQGPFRRAWHPAMVVQRFAPPAFSSITRAQILASLKANRARYPRRFFENPLENRCGKLLAASARRETTDAVEYFPHGDGSESYSLFGNCVDTRHNARLRVRAHHFRNDVGVKQIGKRAAHDSSPSLRSSGAISGRRARGGSSTPIFRAKISLEYLGGLARLSSFPAFRDETANELLHRDPIRCAFTPDPGLVPIIHISNGNRSAHRIASFSSTCSFTYTKKMLAYYAIKSKVFLSLPYLTPSPFMKRAIPLPASRATP